MKRIIAIVTCILIYTSALFASSAITTDSNRKFGLDSIYEDFIHSGLDTEQLVNEVVPEKYRYYFIKYCRPEIRIWCLAIAKHESGWTQMISFVQNADGTKDHGPMALNERNIADPDFRKAYFPKEEIDDENTVYMIACINYFSELYHEFGVSGLYSYNCGRGKYLYGTIPNKTHNYYKVVRSYAKEYSDRLNVIRRHFVLYINYSSPEFCIKRILNSQNKTMNSIVVNFKLIDNDQHKQSAILEKKLKIPEPTCEIDSGYYHNTFRALYLLLTGNTDNENV